MLCCYCVGGCDWCHAGRVEHSMLNDADDVLLPFLSSFFHWRNRCKRINYQRCYASILVECTAACRFDWIAISRNKSKRHTKMHSCKAPSKRHLAGLHETRTDQVHGYHSHKIFSAHIIDAIYVNHQNDNNLFRFFFFFALCSAFYFCCTSHTFLLSIFYTSSIWLFIMLIGC